MINIILVLRKHLNSYMEFKSITVPTRHPLKFDSKLAFEDHLLGIVSRASQRTSILRFVNCVVVDTSAFLRCYYAFVLSILENCFPVRLSAAECHLQLLECRVCSVARHCPDQSFLSMCHRRLVTGLCML